MGFPIRSATEGEPLSLWTDPMSPRQLGPTRRQFLTRSLGVAATLLLPRLAWASPSSADPDRFVLLSDIHIPADRQTTHRKINPVDHLLTARAEILALDPRPTAVVISGDCACRTGLPEDYATLKALLDPISQAGIALHCVPGNHDQRQNFSQAFPEPQAQANSPTADKRTLVVASARARWILLDSLDKTASTPGKLGQPQLDWLAKTLDAQPDKPALVVLHHNLDPIAQWNVATTGLEDTNALLQVLAPRRQVKALIHGHTHCWSLSVEEGIHVINVPATAWVFDPKQPAGWLDVRLRKDGIDLKLNTLDKTHPANATTASLKWR